jgi:hypothetical protein
MGEECHGVVMSLTTLSQLKHNNIPSWGTICTFKSGLSARMAAFTVSGSEPWWTAQAPCPPCPLPPIGTLFLIFIPRPDIRQQVTKNKRTSEKDFMKNNITFIKPTTTSLKFEVLVGDFFIHKHNINMALGEA